MHGYTAEKIELRFHGEKTIKFYRIYYLVNSTTNDSRLLFNWGRLTSRGEGQYKVDMEPWNRFAKVDEKRGKGYRVEDDWHPVTPTPWLLKQAGINIFTEDHASTPAPTPVELKGLDRLNADVTDLISTLTRTRFNPEMVVTYAALREQWSTVRSEVQQAEGRMEVLTALMHAKFEEES